MKKFLFIFFSFHISILISFAQWTQVSTISTTQLNGVRFFNEYTGITAGNLGIWRTTNSGVSWEQVLASADMFNAVSFSDVNNGTAVGMNNLIYRTNNNGINWTQQSIGSGMSYYDVSFPTQSIGYVCGATNGYVYKTTNGGLSWIAQWTQLNITYYGIYMLNQNTGSLVGGTPASETYLSTGNGGTNWTWFFTNGGFSLRAVAEIITYPNVIAVGTNGRIRLSTTAGNTWVFPTSGTNQILNAVLFLNLNTGYIAADSGIILKSTNGGINWIREQTPVTTSLKGISLFSDEKGWAVGANGIVLRKGTFTKIEQINSNIPTKFELYQNYPNPFNPTTKINYELPKNSTVNLVIYDILDHEVMRLVNNEFKQAGRYVVEFNGLNYASGVYFYRIEVRQAGSSTGDFVQSKKMVLIK